MKMQHCIKLTFFWAAVLAFSLIHPLATIGQCPSIPIKLVHTSGTQSYGCTDVTVTSEGDAQEYYPGGSCPYGPYGIGILDDIGSFTFTFSEPVQGVSIDVISLGNWPSFFSVEEMVIDVNGVFYPLTSPGTADGCPFNQPAIISPPGTLRGPIDANGSAKDIFIPGPIYSLKVAVDTVEDYSVSGISVNVYLCCYDCGTDAGAINAANFEACISGPAVVPPATQFVLEVDDILRYILFSNLGNPTASILATNSSPSFSFNPATMSANITYYIAAIAGNELNGNVDGSDFCSDISNIVELIWWPEPTVVFASDATCIQPGGCYDINVSFEGTPPFVLTGQVVSGGNAITTFNEIYNFNSEIMELCLPSTTPNGPLTIEALILSDAHCSCN